MQIKNKSPKELEKDAQDIRDRIIDVVSRKGGHFSSTLGAVELTIGMHYVFDSTKDPFIFDVSHQCYPHKLITGRWEEFETIRQFNGLSGFTKPKESNSDYFVAGHSSTSISLAVGAAKSIKLKKEDRMPVVMIGDGSMTAGMVYEALNELGDLKLPMVIILNDNEMSIAKPIGAISKYLSKLLAGKYYQGFKAKVDTFIKKNMPEGTTYIAKRMEEAMKLITPGILFEEMGVDYIGPIDGHDIEEVIETLQIAKAMKKPVIVHARTVKGKGYKIAEGQHECWHGVGPFNVEDGEFVKKDAPKSATAVFADALCELAKEHENVVGITAAMPSGTGINKLMKEFPERFWDVAIAEQHAVTSMAAMAKEGFKPFITIYSTFLQRGFDQIIHDVCLMNLPVVFAIDRAGIVGNDGETHQGAFDVSYLRFIPNMILFAPRCDETLKLGLNFAYTLKSPSAIRYPRGRGVTQNWEVPYKKIEIGVSQEVKKGKEIAVLSIGHIGNRIIELIDELDAPNEIGHYNMRFIKPLDKSQLIKIFDKYKYIITIEDGCKMGGFGSAILEFANEAGFSNPIEVLGIKDKFLQHGTIEELHELAGIGALSIKGHINKIINAH